MDADRPRGESTQRAHARSDGGGWGQSAQAAARGDGLKVARQCSRERARGTHERAAVVLTVKGPSTNKNDTNQLSASDRLQKLCIGLSGLPAVLL